MSIGVIEEEDALILCEDFVEGINAVLEMSYHLFGVPASVSVLAMFEFTYEWGFGQCF